MVYLAPAVHTFESLALGNGRLGCGRLERAGHDLSSAPDDLSSAGNFGPCGYYAARRLAAGIPRGTVVAVRRCRAHRAQDPPGQIAGPLLDGRRARHFGGRSHQRSSAARIDRRSLDLETGPGADPDRRPLGGWHDARRRILAGGHVCHHGLAAHRWRDRHGRQDRRPSAAPDRAGAESQGGDVSDRLLGHAGRTNQSSIRAAAVSGVAAGLSARTTKPACDWRNRCSTRPPRRGPQHSGSSMWPTGTISGRRVRC